MNKRIMKKNNRGKRKRKNAVRRKLVKRCLLIFAVAVAGMIGFFLYQGYRHPLTSDIVETATQLMQEENYAEAVEQFEEAVANEERLQEKDKASVTESGAPYITEAYRGLGMVYFSMEEYEQAEKNFRQAVEQGGDKTPSLYNMLGISAMKLEDYDGALEAFQAGIELPSEENVDYSAVIQEMKWNRIVCFEKKLDWNSAKVEMEAYTAAYPEDTSAKKEAEFLSTR